MYLKHWPRSRRTKTSPNERAPKEGTPLSFHQVVPFHLSLIMIHLCQYSPVLFICSNNKKIERAQVAESPLDIVHSSFKSGTRHCRGLATGTTVCGTVSLGRGTNWPLNVPGSCRVESDVENGTHAGFCGTLDVRARITAASPAFDVTPDPL